MRARGSMLLAVPLLLSPVIVLGQGTEKAKREAEASDHTTTSARRGKAPSKRGPSSNRVYAKLTIGELVSEDPSRWTEKMQTYVEVGGFVTHAKREGNGDIEIRICDTPKLEGMDRAHCIMAQCISKLPCGLPRIGKPITVLGISRYDAGVGHHWWEIHPIEQIEK